MSEAPTLTLRDVAVAALADCVGQSAVEEQPELNVIAIALERLQGMHWTDAVAHLRATSPPADAPLWKLADTLKLSDVEVLAVALASAVEEELLVGRALARMQAPIGGSRPTLGLLSVAFEGMATNGRPGSRPLEELVRGNAVASGLLVLSHDSAPLAERPVLVPPHLCLALAGVDAFPAQAQIGLRPADDMLLPPSVLEAAARQGNALADARAGSARRVLVIRSGFESEASAVAAAVAASLGRRALFMHGEFPPGLAPLLHLRGLVPVLQFELAPGERRRAPPIAAWRGPLLVTCGPDGTVESADGTAVSWRIPVPARAERERLWCTALDVAPGNALATELARDHRHGTGRIAQLGRLMRHQLAAQDRAEPTRADLTAAAWAGESAGLDALAEPLPQPVEDGALVMPPALRRELDLFLHRCRARDGLVDALGAAARTRYHPGVRALFVGASGTGKTLAAGWLATRLGMPLYRVDLASVTSKYIGETEKNLAQLLARAEHAEVMLLFDEADSLFGKRTDIKDSNDRFANAQTNYLLQRIETFDGIALLTSNGRGRFDSAFTRRLDAVIEFPQPGPEERRALWHAHLGTAHDLTPHDINRLAARVDLCGGHVRNAVLTAAVLARGDNANLSYTHVFAGVAAECRKLGRGVPAELGAFSES